MSLRRRGYLEESKPEYFIKKSSSGSGRWQIWVKNPKGHWPPEVMVRKNDTKREATLLMKALGGDKVSAKAWYRLRAEKYKKQHGEKEMWRQAAQDAYIHGMSPGFVGADPETGDLK